LEAIHGGAGEAVVGEVANARTVGDREPAAAGTAEPTHGARVAAPVDTGLAAGDRAARATAWWTRTTRVLVPVASDVSALAISAIVATLLATRSLPRVSDHWRPAALVLLVFVGNYAAAGLYPGFGIGAVQRLRSLTRRTTLTFSALALADFFLSQSVHFPAVLAISWLTSLVAVPAARWLALSWASQWHWWSEPTVVIGPAQAVGRIVRLLAGALTVGYRPVAIISDEASRLGRDCAGVPCVGGLSDVPALAARGPATALLVDDGRESYMATGAWLRAHFRHVIVVPDRAELPAEGAVVRNLGGILGIGVMRLNSGWRMRVVKRATDLLVGAVALVLAAPLLALAAIAIKLASKGPVLFAQTRCGMGGKRIRVWKLRTMSGDAEDRLHEVLHADPAAQREWEARFKLQDDPRVIPGVGFLLRSLSIDELPQLWNVITGDMSLVGPRPFPDYHLQRFPCEFLEMRRRVRPGITGLWQVMVRGGGGIEEQQLLDSYYIRNWSLWLDACLLAKTIPVVLARRGAY
jgi:Undecaprenyl-phosphate galactose phosphotransferase WbaP